MAQENKLYSQALLDMLTASLAGAGDELSFGALKKIDPAAFDLIKQENPKSYFAGQVGSYFVPGFGLLKAGKAAKGAKAGYAAAKEAPLISKILSGAVKTAATPQQLLNDLGRVGGSGAESLIKKLLTGESEKLGAKALNSAASEGVSAATQAAGQSLARKAIGDNPADAKDIANDTTAAAVIGSVLGAGKPAIKGLAKGLYASKQIVDPTAPKEVRDFVINKLMNEGVVGGEATFSDISKKSKQAYRDILDPLMEPKASKKVPIEDVLETAANNAEKKIDIGSSDYPEFNRKIESTVNKYGENPTVGDIGGLEKNLNEELFSLSAKQRRGEAPVSGEMEAIGNLKKSVDDWNKNFLIGEYGSKGKQAYNQAKESYKLGREIERAQDRFSSPGDKAGLGRSIESLLNYLPARTGAGVALDRFSNNLGKAAGRSTEAYSRYKRKKNQNDVSDEKDLEIFDEKDPYKDI